MIEDTDDTPTREELGWELVELFEELRVDQLNEVMAKNVPLETLEFFASYAGDFCEDEIRDPVARKRLPNLLLLGYLLRVLEERLIGDPETYDA
jgi:hypothetical protein